MLNWYENAMEMSTYQGTMTCAVMTDMGSRDRVLEVGCGPGKHSVMLAQTLLKPKGVLVSCDYSGAMVKRLQENYATEDNDYSKIAGNKFFMDTETDYTAFADESCKSLKNTCDLNAIVPERAGPDFNKFVFGCQANNELLPFPDSYFDAYLSNLSLMIVHNHKNQLNEAFRVMKQGSAACFTIWGQMDHCLQFTCIEEVIARHLSQEERDKMKAMKSNFDLYRDKGVQLKADLEEVGFTGVKIWEQPMNILFRNGEEYMTKFGDGRLAREAQNRDFDQATMDQMRAEAIQMFDELTGAGTTDLKTFSVGVVLAFKD